MAAAVLYAVVTVALLALADAGNGAVIAIWLVAPFCIGWIARSPWMALLPFLAVPIAVPFGYPQEWSSGHDPLPLWSGALLAAPIQAATVIVGVGCRSLYERLRGKWLDGERAHRRP